METTMKGLRLFSRTSDQRSWNLASFHSPHSLTWSWILSFRLPRGDEGRWLGFHRWQTNDGGQWLLQIARCALQWHRQRPMWYRDLHARCRDELDTLEDFSRRPAPARSPFKPTVIDGGQSLH
jgi:hypothetical protein